MKNLEKDVDLRFNNFSSERVQNSRANFIYFYFRHTLLMDLGNNQQQHLTLYSGGDSRGRLRGCGCLG